MLTDEQQEIRSKGVGGSEVAAVLGMSDYAAQIDVWQDKTGERIVEKPDITNEDPVLLGNLFERPILQWYAVKNDCALEVPGTLVHPEHPIVRATPDAVARTLTPPRCVEVKRPHRTAHHWGEEGTDEIDEVYYPQTMWEMAVTGLQDTDVVALLGRIPTVYHVPFDVEMFDSMRQIVEDWWARYVVTCTPPPIDGSNSYLDYLRAKYPRNFAGPRKPATPEVDQWVAQLQEAKRLAKEAERLEGEARNNIVNFIGDADGCEGEWGHITWRRTKDIKRLDKKKLLDHLQLPDDLLKQFTATSDGHRRFLPTFKKGA